jgi:hypothetical protein
MAAKRKAIKIGTHSGTFHCDEALGCWMLKQTEAYAGAACDEAAVAAAARHQPCLALCSAAVLHTHPARQTAA